MRMLAGLALSAALMAAPVRVVSQVRVTGADLRGTVVDQSRAVLPGASVEAINVETGVTRVAATDGRGRYVIGALPPGTYTIVAERPGFSPQVQEGVSLPLGQLVEVDFELRLAGLEAEVVVVGNAAQTAVAANVSRETIEGLPIQARNYVGFAALTPGVAVVGSTQPGAQTSGLSFTGQRDRFNNLTVDGLENNDRVLGSAQASFSQEAVQEFQVLTSSYSAEFGGATGGIVNIVTRSGTNEHRGGLYAFHLANGLSARNYFERFDEFGAEVGGEKAHVEQTQWGVTLGGPLARQRTFYFGSFERDVTDASNVVTIDPTAAAVLASGGFPVALGNVPYGVTTTEVLAKVTHNWRPTRTLVTRVHSSDVANGNFGAFGGITAQSHGAAQDRRDWGLSASETDVLGDRWLAETRVQVAHEDQRTTSLDPSCGGPCLEPSQGGPAVVLPGVARVGRSAFEPTERSNNRVQARHTLTYVAGDHTVKTGVDFTHLRQEASLSYNFGGEYTFVDLPPIPGLLPQPVSAIQAFALGLPVLYVQGYGDGSSPFEYSEIAVFAQDDWRLGDRLTVKAGLRYQRQLFPDVDVTVPDLGGATLTYPFPLGNHTLAPRLSLTLDPAGDGRTSVRGAWGLFYGNQLTTILGATDLFASGARTQLLVLPFPGSVVAWGAPGHRLPEPPAFPSVSIAVGPDARTPMAHQASVGLTRALPGAMTLGADLVLVRGRHNLGAIDYNPLVPSLGPGRRPNDLFGIPGTSSSLAQYTDFGRTWYTGLLVSLHKRLTGRHELRVAYTLSKAEDNSSSFSALAQDNGRGRNPGDPFGLPLGFDPDAERGPTDGDQRHRLVVSGSYLAPGGVEVSGILTAATGRPFTPLAGADLNGDGVPSTDRARRVPGDPATSVGRNSARLAGTLVADMRVSKRLAAGPRVSLTLVAEVFNLFDRANFISINDVFGVGAYPDDPQRDALGRVTYGLHNQARSPRQMQMAARLGF